MPVRTARTSNPRRANGVSTPTTQAAGAKTNPAQSRDELIRQLRAENDELQDRLDKVADLASAQPDEDSEDEDTLVETLNNILDVAAPDEDHADGDDDSAGND